MILPRLPTAPARPAVPDGEGVAEVAALPAAATPGVGDAAADAAAGSGVAFGGVGGAGMVAAASGAGVVAVTSGACAAADGGASLAGSDARCMRIHVQPISATSSTAAAPRIIAIWPLVFAPCGDRGFADAVGAAVPGAAVGIRTLPDADVETGTALAVADGGFGGASIEALDALDAVDAIDAGGVAATGGTVFGAGSVLLGVTGMLGIGSVPGGDVATSSGGTTAPACSSIGRPASPRRSASLNCSAV